MTPESPPKIAKSPKRPKDSPVNAVVIATGSEFALGSVVDTNSARLSRILSSMGVKVVRHLTAPDDLSLLSEVIRESREKYDLAVMTGGIGPTEDDFTRLAAAQAFGVPLYYDPEQYAHVAHRMRRFYKAFPSNNHRQAWLPHGSIPIANPFGSAPAFAFKTKENHLAIFLPGVPREAIGLSETTVKDLIRETFPSLTGVIITRVIIAAQLGESRVDELISDLILASENPKIGLTAALSETKIRISAAASDEAAAARLIEPIESEIIRRLGPFYAGEGEEGVFKTLASKIASSDADFFFQEDFTQGIFSEKLYNFLPEARVKGSLILPLKGEGAGPIPIPMETGDKTTLCRISVKPAGEVRFANPNDPETLGLFDLENFKNPKDPSPEAKDARLDKASPRAKNARRAKKGPYEEREIITYFKPPKGLIPKGLGAGLKIFYLKSALPLSGPPEVIRERAASLAAYHVVRFLGFLENI